MHTSISKLLQKLMSKPVILLVDPEPEVLWAIKADLQRQYNGRFKILQAESYIFALEKLKQLQEQNNSVTLLVVEQQSSKIASMEFLKVVREMFPKAKRFLLTVHDTDEIPNQLPLPKALVV
jgi:thioredoxin reductase (NADPH)